MRGWTRCKTTKLTSSNLTTFMKTRLCLHILLFLTIFGTSPRAHAQGTAFNYQGRLVENGVVANGNYDFIFTVHDAVTGGSLLGTSPVVNPIVVSAGQFAVTLNFGASVFTGPARWLEISTRTARGAQAGGWTLMVPRQPLLPTPYAIHAASAATVKDGAVTSRSLADGAVTGAKLAPAAVGRAQLSTPGVPAAGQVLAYDGNNLSWINAGGGGGGGGPWLVNGTTAFYSAGSVGLGTSSPTAGYRLEVEGATLLRTGNGTVEFGSPNAEMGLSITPTLGNRADVRFNGTTLKLVAAVGVGPPAAASGIEISTSGSVTMTGGSPGLVTFGSPNAETGSSIIRGGNRADLRFDGTSLKLVAGSGVGPPSGLNGLFVTTAGNVGIGSGSPVSKLEVVAQDAIRLVGFQPFLTLLDSNKGYAMSRIQGVDGKLAFHVGDGVASGTVRNIAVIDANGLSVNGNVTTSGNANVRSITIRGGADLAEPFAMSHSGVEPGSVVVIDEKNPGKLKASTRAYDKKVAGIVSGANGIRPGISMIQEDMLEAGENVALSGRVYVKADTSAGPIEPGDLLTTSSTAGRAMKAADHDQAQGAIIGKAMTPLTEGEGMVLVLVTLQ